MDDKKGRGSSTISSNNRLPSRKGQVTIFIIVGIVILFVFAGVLYFMKNTVTEQVTAEGTPIIASVPAEFQPLQIYTENCLRDVAKQGLKLLGQQGGYIYPELKGKFTATPTDADGLLLSSTAVPYWYYKSNPNSQLENTYSSLQPKLRLSEDPAMSVEAQLNRFVQEKISSCLNQYQPFIEQGFSVTVDNTEDKVSASVGESSVNFLFESSVLAKKGSAEKELDQFYIQIPLPLKHYFDVASQITTTQQENRFLERQGLDLLSAYSRKDAQYLAPISLDGYELVSAVSWSEQDMQKKYTQILTSYTPMLQFLGSANFYYANFNNLMAQKITDNSVLTLTGAEDLDVSFAFIPSQIYFKTNSENGIVKPNSFIRHADFLTFGFQQYETHYDISYPVLITLRDATALDGEDFIFNFALESNIRNNAPASAGEPEVNRDPVALSPLHCRPEQKETGLLKTVVVDSYTKEPVEAVRIGFSIPEQEECEMGLTDNAGELEDTYPAVYGGVVSYVKQDYLTNFYPLDTYKLKEKKALIGYAIADVASPQVVELDRLKTINLTVVKKSVEKCITPLYCEYTTGAHAALLVPFKDISCSKGTQQCFFPSGSSLFGAGKPIAEVNAEGSLSKYNQYYLTQKTAPLNSDEQAMVVLERVKGIHDEVISDPFSAAATIEGTQPVSIQLVPGVYRVTAQIFKKNKVAIPADDRCFAYDVLTVTKQECSTVASSVQESYLEGSIQWDTPATYLTITPEDLYPSQELSLTLPAFDLAAVPEKISIPQNECGGFLCAGSGCLFQACKEKKISVPGRVVEDVEAAGLIGKVTNSTDYRALLRPTFK